MEIKKVFLKKRAEFGKQCIFDICGPCLDEEIKPSPDAMVNYIAKTHCNASVQHTKQFALHEAQTVGRQTKSSGMFHFEGGWPKEINPKDEETTTRFRRRVEKDDDWAPKLRNLFKRMEHNVRQNGTLNIYEHYFDNMVPTELVRPRDLRTVNVYENPQTPARSVNDISWSPDSGSKMVVSYYSQLGTRPDYSNIVYIWQIDNPNKPWLTLKATSATLVSEFNPRDPSVLASGLMSGQVCSWDIRTGTTPVQTSHRQFSHRDTTTAVKWITTKSNTEFFSSSMDGRVMWWDTRRLREPIEVLVFDLQTPNEPRMDHAIGVSSANFEQSVSTKFMFGLDNGIVISGSRKARTPAEKLALSFDAYYGPVASVDRNCFNPKIFLTVGNCTARVWTEDVRDTSLVSTRFLKENPVGGCWNKVRHSIFYVTTCTGVLTVWDLLVSLSDPILAVQLCEEKLTAITAHERGDLLAVGNSAGRVYLVESTEVLHSFDRNDKTNFSSYLERCTHFTKVVDMRLKEIKLTRTYDVEDVTKSTINDKHRKWRIHDKLRDQRKRIKMIKAIKTKRKFKDESVELQTAEEKFFEIVEKEKHKYEEDELLSLPKLSPSMRKIVARKIDKHSILATDEPEEVTMKTPLKKTVAPKKAKIFAPVTEMVQPVEQEMATTELSLPPLAEVIVESPVKEISKRKRRKRLMPVAFRLPRPCKVGVCKPDICCRRKLSTRFAGRAVRGRAKRIRGKADEETGSKDDAGAKTPVGSRDEVGQKKKESREKSMRTHKRKGPTGETICSLRGMTELPEELAEAVSEAKRKIREARRSSDGRIKAKKHSKRVSKRRAVATEKSAETPRRFQGYYPAKEITQSTMTRIRAARKGKRAIVMDPCILWKPPSLLKDLQSLLRGPLPESIEKKANLSAAHMREIKAPRDRVYRRISDFHLVD